MIGMIGLGKMGANMVSRLRAGGHRCVVFDLDAERIQTLAAVGAACDFSPCRRAHRGDRARAGGAHGEAGAIIIDGGNTYYKDDFRRARTLRMHGVHYIDVGTSGGVWGAELGYCLMIGGPREAVQYLDPLFASLAPGPRDGGRGVAHGSPVHGYL